MDARLALPAAAVWLAALIALPFPSVLVPIALSAAGIAIVLLGVVFIAGFLHRRMAPLARGLLVTLAVVSTAVALLAAVAAVGEPQRHPPSLADFASDGALVEMTVVLTETVPPAAQNAPPGARAGFASPAPSHYSATLRSARSADVRVDAPVPMLVFAEAPPGGAGIGAVLAIRGTLTATAPEDEVSYLVFAEVAGEVRESPPPALDWANRLRATFATTAARLGGDGAALLPGLAIGDRSAVDGPLDAAMKQSSLSHLTAVSGANCAVLVGLIMLAGGYLGLGRGLRIAASLVVLLGFVVLVTPEPSVMRAALMAALVLLTLASGRPVRGLPVLAGAVLLLLLLDPWLARNYGFVLSVLATGGLLLLSGPLSRLLGHVLPLWLAMVIAVPLAAQLVCQPVLILLSPTLPLYGVVANMLVAPAAPIATVIGLFACICLPIAPSLGAVLAQLAWLPASWVAAVARFFAGLPLAQLPWPGGVAGSLLLAALSALFLVGALAPLPAARRRFVMLAFGAACVLMIAVGAGSRIAGQLGRPTDWQVAACDIGQGDAVLVRSAGRSALIDVGPDPTPLRHCLDELGVERVDLLILSHFDLDHVGGAAAILGRVDAALVGPSGGPDDDELVAALAAGGARVERVNAGHTGLLGELRWKVLWPPEQLGGIEPGNDASVSIVFEPMGACVNGCLSSVFLGDLGQSSQDRLLRATPGLASVDLVKVAHHGSADQSPGYLYSSLLSVGSAAWLGDI